MDETNSTETRISRTRKVAVAAALVAGLSGAFTIAGISAASSDPGSDARSTEVDSDGPMDIGDPADCELFTEGSAMFEDGTFDHGEMGDMMGESFSDMWGRGAVDMMGAGTHMGA